MAGLRLEKLGMLALLVGMASACASDRIESVVQQEVVPPAQALPTSLHGTAQGMKTWYTDPTGFGALINVPYEQLACGQCHTGKKNADGTTSSEQDCAQCHNAGVEPSTASLAATAEATCLACHSRQASENALTVGDVHRARGMKCWDCHTSREIHGDGKAYLTMFDEGATEARCENCHQQAPATRSHTVHGKKLACATCHMQTSVTCYNCHFETEITEKKKLPYAKLSGWQFLGNYRGQVYPMNFQSVTYQGKAFVAIGPYYGHTIANAGRQCNDCHGIQAVRDYNLTGKITVAKWDPVQKKIIPSTGVMPVPADFEKAFEMDFLARENGQWIFLKTGADRMHMLRGTPLTQAQINRLVN
ncbi:MAG TPA: cytochrome c3 family protein [Gemmatimonadaceae bacterium]